MVDDSDDGDQGTVTQVDDRTVNERRTPQALVRRDVSKISRERYQLLDQLGRGGMGEVLSARDRQLGREVAVKRMLNQAPTNDAIERFLREARVQGRLDHPAIVPVHELGRDDDGLPYFVMKKVSGTTLADIIKADEPARFPRQRLLRAFVDVCLAVEFAHMRGVLHRDLKPANIVLGDYGEVYVLDWGVAKVIGDSAEYGELADISGSATDPATLAGTLIGTPGYMAPEQARGSADLDARADVYALGCVLFEILTGQRLHARGHTSSLKLGTDVDASPSRRSPEREIPPELDAACLDALRDDRDARTASARELGACVERFLDGDRDLAARRALAKTHLERAEAAMRADDSGVTRRTAMQEAGRALALDTSLSGAAALVSHLMVAPPAVMPIEVVHEIAEDGRASARDYLRLAVWLFAGFLLITPLLWWVAPSGTRWVPLLAGAIVGGAALNWYASLRVSVARVMACILFNAVIVAIVARMYSPFLIAPGLATLIAMGTTITTIAPMWIGRTVIPLLSIGAIVGPWLLERADLISRTTRVAADGVVELRVAAIGGDEVPILMVCALYTCVLMIAAAMFATEIRRREHELKRRLHLQTWQLRQLVAT